MKVFRKKLIPILVAVLSLTLGIALTACGGHDDSATEYDLVLDLNGGTLEGETTLKLKSGDNVYDAVKELVPQKEESVFEAWYEGEEPLAQTRTMPAEALTLTAHYIDGIEIVYRSNAPQDASVRGSVARSVGFPGDEFTVAESGFTVEGYRFLGWSTTAGGAVTYTPGQKVTLQSSLTLYAAWEKGLTDRFGGQDYIFRPASDPTKVYLLRGGVELEGTLEGSDFTFTLKNGTELKGRCFAETYAYEHEGLEGTYHRYDCYKYPAGSDSIVSDDTLTLDNYGTATRTYVDEVSGQTVTDTGYIGTLTSEDYLFNCETSTLQGENSHVGEVVMFRFETKNSQRVYTPSLGEVGEYAEFLTPDGSVGGLGNGSAILDGYGNITYWEVFEGNYSIENTYGNGLGGYSYKVKAYLHDSFDGGKSQLEVLNSYYGHNYKLENGVFTVEFYTLPLMDSYGYVEPRSEKGSFTGTGECDGETLTLDGYGNFPDSAVYTHGGRESTGSYTTSASPTDGSIFVVVNEMNEYGQPTGKTYNLRLPATTMVLTGTFTQANEGIDDPYAEYLPISMGGEMQLTYVLRVYESDYTAEGVENAVNAELLFGTAQKDGNGTVTHYEYSEAAKGYITAEELAGGYATMYTFHRTQTLEGAAGKDIAKSFRFMVGTAYDGVYYLSRSVFYTFDAVYENKNGGERTEKYYTEIREEDGEGFIYYMNLSTSLAFGSLYYDSEADIYYPGGFDLNTTGYVFGPFGTFTFVNMKEYGQEVFWFDVQLDSQGDPAIFRRVYATEEPVFRFNPTGDLDTQNIFLALREDEAIYSPSGTMEGDLIRGTANYVGSTAFGDGVYAFVSAGNEELFRFIYTEYDYYEMGFGTQRILVYYVYNNSLASKVPNLTLTGAAGTLKMDGYHSASLTSSNGTVKNGEYYTNVDNTVVYFRSGNQTDAYKIDGSSYIVLDAAYGRQPFYYRGESYTIDFDGQLAFSVYLGTLRVGNGFYKINAVDPLECELHGNIGGSDLSITVTLTIDGLTIRNEDTSGVYISDDFAILQLDGYGSGRYYPSNGSGGRTIYFDIASSEDGYLAARSEYFEYFNFIIDNETKTFRIPEYLDKEYTYYSEDTFNALVLDTEGNAWLNGSSGFYQVVGSTLKLYLQDPNTYSFGTTTIPSLPSDGADRSYTVNGETYYRWKSGEKITFNGTLEVQDTEGKETGEYTATLTFTPTGDNMFYAGATFTYTIDGVTKTESLQVVNRYYNYATGKYMGMALYNPVTYEYSPFDEYTFNPTKEGGCTFKTVIKEQVMRMYDGFEEVPEGSEPKNYLEETHIGFGPINLTEITLSGRLDLGNGTVLEFKGAPVITIEHNSTTMGPMYMAIFTVGGTKYAVDYNKFDGDYWLYMVATYSELEVSEGEDHYTVGLQKFLYSSGGYEFDPSVTEGVLHKIVLYRGTGTEKEAIVAFNGKVNADNSAWLLDLGNYDVNGDSSDSLLGKVYLFEFNDDLTQVTDFHGYKFVQAPLANVTTACYANFAVGTDGKIVKPIAMLIWNTDSYELLLFKSMEEAGKNKWTFHGVNGYAYTIEVMTNENGDYRTDVNGNWVVELVSQTEETASTQPTESSQPNA